MTLVNVAQVNMSGVGGGLGISRFWFNNPGGIAATVADANNVLARLHTFYTAIAPATPNVVTFSFNPNVDAVDVATGLLFSVTPAAVVPGNIVGGSAGAFVSGTGARLEYRTGVRRRGREIRGATMIIPLDSGQTNATGNLTAAIKATINGAFAAYFAGMNADGNSPCVYGRKHAASLHYPAEPGTTALVVSGTTNDQPAFLRRRRN